MSGLCWISTDWLAATNLYRRLSWLASSGVSSLGGGGSGPATRGDVLQLVAGLRPGLIRPPLAVAVADAAGALLPSTAVHATTADMRPVARFVLLVAVFLVLALVLSAAAGAAAVSAAPGLPSPLEAASAAISLRANDGNAASSDVICSSTSKEGTTEDDS